MNRILAGGLAFLLATGCIATVSEHDDPVLTTFSEIDQHIDEEVFVRGFVSQTHEATGLYFNRRDLLEGNPNCISLQPFGGVSHGEVTTISGRLLRTDCGLGRICTNVCDRYVLVRRGG